MKTKAGKYSHQKATNNSIMTTNISQFIDFEKVDVLLEGFNKSTGFVSALIDLDGNILSKSGWRQVCTEFHRVHASKLQSCRVGVKSTNSNTANAGKYHFYKCLNGLVDISVPIIIKGEYVADLFSGQFFLEKPNKEHFIKQAQILGLDKTKYLDLMNLVPIVTEEIATKTLDFLHQMILYIIEQSFQKQELSELEKRLEFALTSSKTGAWDLDLTNQTAIRTLEHDKIFGYHQLLPEWTYEMFLGHVLEEFRMEVDSKFKKAIESKAEWNFECKIRRIDNEIRWIWACGQHLFDENGDSRRIAGIVQDITESKQLQMELELANTELEYKVQQRTSQLEASNKELEAFSYSVSHDLRAPLRHINGYVDLLRKKYFDSLDEKAQYYLDVISGASKQMGSLIDDLLEYSKTGRKELSKTVFDMNHLIQEVLIELEPIKKDRNIMLDIQNMPQVYADYSLLKLVWTNLLDNAIKYTRNNAETKISLEYYTEAKNVVFCVRDNGVGFDMNFAHKLFGVFQRLHSQTDFEGTGIGLANVQRIIHKHGGKVWAEAELNHGACFYFSLTKVGD